MARPNFQRIIDAHGKLPDALMKGMGMTILDSTVDSSATVITKSPEKKEAAPDLNAASKPGEVKLPPENKKEVDDEKPLTPEQINEKYSHLVDKSGKKLIEYNWTDLRSKATEDKVYKSKMNRLQILEHYAKQ